MSCERVEVRLFDENGVVVQSYEDISKELDFYCYDLNCVSLSYVDEEGDRVSVKCSADFNEAVRAARACGRQVLVIDVCDAQITPIRPITVIADEKSSTASSRNNQTLELIEALQKRLEANLREIQSITAFLDANGMKLPPSLTQSLCKSPCIPQKEEEVAIADDVPVKVTSPVSIVVEESKSGNIVGDEPVLVSSPAPSSTDDCGIAGTCHRASKRVIDECVEVTASVPSTTSQVASNVSQQCQELFSDSSAKAAEQTARQSEISEAETREVVNLVQSTTDRLLQQQKCDRDHDEPDFKRARELADEVQRICAALSKETSDSCEAITRCVAEMVRNM